MKQTLVHAARICSPAALVVLAACAPQAETATKPLTLVEVQQVKAAPYVHRQVLTGAVQARAETPMAFLVGGRLVQLHANVGDRVAKGQIIAQISPAEQRADVVAAQAALAAAEARLTETRATLDRQTSLWDQGLTTRSSRDGAQTAWETASNARDNAQAQLDLANEAFGYTDLKANADGVVLRRLSEVDEVVQAGSPVFIIAEDGPRNVVINLQETAIAGWERQRPITVALVSDPSVSARGTVREIAPALDATGTVQIKIAIDADLPLGAPVTVVLDGLSSDRVVVPAQALWQADGGPAVWVVSAENSVSLTPVEVERFGADGVVIAEGLSDGQRVVTLGTQFLVPGQIVDIPQGDGK